MGFGGVTRPSARPSKLPPLPVAAVIAAGLAAAVWLVALRPGTAPGAADREPGFPPEAIVSESAPLPPPSGSAGTAPAASGATVASVPEVGRPAPDFTASDLDGRPVRLSDLRGKPVLINFWATWCPPCREEMPQIEAFYRRHRDQVEVLGVGVGETAEQVRAFLKDNPYSWRFVVDPDLKVADRYRVFGIPVSYFIDKDGIIRGFYMGAMDAEQIRAFARQAGVDVD